MTCKLLPRADDSDRLPAIGRTASPEHGTILTRWRGTSTAPRAKSADLVR